VPAASATGTSRDQVMRANPDAYRGSYTS
jgi:hypothetical protein